MTQTKQLSTLKEERADLASCLHESEARLQEIMSRRNCQAEMRCESLNGRPPLSPRPDYVTKLNSCKEEFCAKENASHSSNHKSTLQQLPLTMKRSQRDQVHFSPQVSQPLSPYCREHKSNPFRMKLRPTNAHSGSLTAQQGEYMRPGTLVKILEPQRSQN